MCHTFLRYVLYSSFVSDIERYQSVIIRNIFFLIWGTTVYQRNILTSRSINIQKKNFTESLLNHNKTKQKLAFNIYADRYRQYLNHKGN